MEAAGSDQVQLLTSGLRPGAGVAGGLVGLNRPERHPRGDKCSNVIGGVKGGPKDKSRSVKWGSGLEDLGLFSL